MKFVIIKRVMFFAALSGALLGSGAFAEQFDVNLNDYMQKIDRYKREMSDRLEEYKSASASSPVDSDKVAEARHTFTVLAKRYSTLLTELLAKLKEGAVKLNDSIQASGQISGQTKKEFERILGRESELASKVQEWTTIGVVVGTTTAAPAFILGKFIGGLLAEEYLGLYFALTGGLAGMALGAIGVAAIIYNYYNDEGAQNLADMIVQINDVEKLVRVQILATEAIAKTERGTTTER